MAIPFSFSAQAVAERLSCSMPYAVVILDDEKATGQGNAETVSSTKVNAASFVCEAYTKKEQEKKARKVRGKLIDFPGKADMRP